MQRSKKMILTSHCILNVNAKIENIAQYKGIFTELIDMIEKYELAIIQLPCPETILYGINRNGHTKEQFDNLFFRKECRKMLEPILIQLDTYLNNGYEIVGLIGIDGSPSCGINKTCYNPFGKTVIDKGLGVFMEELSKMLNENDMNIPMIGIDEDDVYSSLNKIEEFLNMNTSSKV